MKREYNRPRQAPVARAVFFLAAAFVLLRISLGQALAEDDLPFEEPKNYRDLPATALIETTKGPFEIEFYREQAPVSVANFEYLGRKGVYNGIPFHRYVPGFVIQGGDPTRTGKGGPGWTLPSEITGELKHLKGTLGWARLPGEVNPERRSNGSQFYITLAPAPGIDGFYTIFAHVIRGMETVLRLREGDEILAVRFPKKKQERGREGAAERKQR